MSMIEIKMQQVDGMLSIVDKIKFNKITSSSVRKYLLNLANELLKSNEKINIKLKDLKDKIFNGFSQDDLNKFQYNLNQITDLLKQNKTAEADKLDKDTLESYPELAKAYKQFYNEFLNIQNEVEYYNIEKIDINEFTEAMVDQDLEITIKELEILKPLF